jgi:D-beta-D-heptose 7-phosphate kinase/D-beta-D-heptose 1-phosphate adenosyltransferase
VLQGELLTAIFQCAQEKGIPCIVDPKGQDFTKYRGCSLITPNYGESCAALGLKSDPGHRGEDLGRALQERYGLNDVLVTMGPSGMVYVPKDPAEAAIFRSPRAREVYDVSGAGDTVAALMALSLAAKIPAQDAVDFANLAAGIVVEKRGTQPVLRRELEERLETTNAALYARYFGKAPVRLHTSAKIHTAASLAALMEEEHKKGRSFVFTNGCFDILHAGHVTLLEQAKAFGSALIVAVNTDESVRALNKGSERPLVSLADRMKVLAALSCVDYVLPFGEETPLQLIEHLKPDVLVKGGDYRLDTIVGASSVIARGGSVEIIPLLPARSTTSLVNAIREHGRGAAHGLG